jgi:predicted ATPase
LAESIFSEAARAHVLATSREALRAVGEWVYRLGPMPLPALADDITAAAAGGFPGIQLFVQRARAALPGFELSDALAPAVVGICRRLDGIPLAIELAAARVALLGVRGLATQVQDRLHLLGGLRRDGPRRHRTIETLLDWSYHLLSTAEQVVLRRLSVFRGSFTLGSATFVAADGEAQRALVTEALLDLVTKSLVSGVEHGEATEYRLLETTRAYAAAKLLADPDQVETRRRHALHMRALLLEADVAWERMTRQEWRTAYTRWVDDVRAALDWAFSSEQGEALGLELTSLSLTLADQTSLMTDFAERAFRALEVLRRTPDPPPILAMRLGTLPAYLSAHQNAHLQALARTQDFLGALDLAEGIGEPKYQAGPLTALWVNEFQHGRYSHAMRWSQRLHEVAGDSKDPILALIAKRTAAQTHHFLGQHDAARRLAEDVLGSSALRIPLAYFPSAVDLRVSMRIVLARVLWMQGRAESAADMVEECLQFAQSDTPPASCQALALAAVPVAMWCGDWTLAGRRLDQLRDHLEAYPFAYWQPWYEAFAAVHERQENDGEPSPRPDSVSAPVSDMLGDHLPTFDARTLSGTTLARVRAGEAGWCAPEVLGAHAETLRRGGSVLASEAAKLFREALAIARAQGALAWELRAAMRLATLWKDEGRARSAHALLSTVRRRFVETRMGTDLITADSLLRELARAPGSR